MGRGYKAAHTFERAWATGSCVLLIFRASCEKATLSILQSPLVFQKLEVTLEVPGGTSPSAPT